MDSQQNLNNNADHQFGNGKYMTHAQKIKFLKTQQQMTQEIIYTEDYALIVSDEKIKPLDWCINANTNSVFQFYTKRGISNNDKKIIGHRPLKDAPILKGVPLLPEFSQEDDVEKLANDYANQFADADFDNSFDCVADVDFKAGYNKAKETYKYTEEDLIDALFEALNTPKEECCINKTKDSIVRSIIKSLQQPKRPKYFECEMVQLNNKPGSSYSTETIYKPKTTTNSQGQTELVGQYIF